MENLAPAGNQASLERAEAAGADAVYLGYTAFSARAGAGNFDRQQLAEALRFAHLRDMRVHVTVNTLVKDAELPEALEVLRMLRDMGADAVLIQDLGLLRLARACCPGLTVHASTQMAIHNRTGAAWCRNMGIRRVVLARECSLEEIRKCAGAGIEIEVFGHGAQCVSVSGLCLFSSMLGERSGNRGRCAQPCRMEYELRGRRGAWLSPRDVCLRDDLPALRDAGAVSVKLEGRLKRPEYVAVTAGSYARGLRSLEEGAFAPADAAEREGLLQIFNRGGFMRGYAFGCEDAGVIDPGRVSHQGVAIGRIESLRNGFARARLTKTLHDGDGLELRGDGRSGELIYAGPETAAGEAALLRLRPDLAVKAGDRVFRLTDASQLEAARSLPGRRIAAGAHLRAMPGEPLTLTVTAGGQSVTRQGETVQAARTRAAEPEELLRNLGKTGNTVFGLAEAAAETAGAFVPVSALNALRREALEALAETLARANTPDNGPEGEYPAAALPEGNLPPMAVARTEEQAALARERGFRVIRYPEDWREEALEELLQTMPEGDWLRLPDVCEEDTLETIHGLVTRYAGRLGGIVLGTVGQLGRTWPVPFGAGSGIPVMNRQAAALLLAEGCAFVTASPELTGRELRTLLEGNPPIVTQTYGRTQLMLLHHCPARTALGLKKGHRDCRLCDAGAPDSLRGLELKDRTGAGFPLLRQRLPEGCLVRLMNSLPTELPGREELPWQSLELTDEGPEEAARALDAAAEGRRSGLRATAGHWNRPVE